MVMKYSDLIQRSQSLGCMYLVPKSRLFSLVVRHSSGLIEVRLCTLYLLLLKFTCGGPIVM